MVCLHLHAWFRAVVPEATEVLTYPEKSSIAVPVPGWESSLCCGCGVLTALCEWVLNRERGSRLSIMLADVGASPWSSPLCPLPGFSEGNLQGVDMHSSFHCVHHPGSIYLGGLSGFGVSSPPPGNLMQSSCLAPVQNARNPLRLLLPESCCSVWLVRP